MAFALITFLSIFVVAFSNFITDRLSGNRTYYRYAAAGIIAVTLLYAFFVDSSLAFSVLSFGGFALMFVGMVVSFFLLSGGINENRVAEEIEQKFASLFEIPTLRQALNTYLPFDSVDEGLGLDKMKYTLSRLNDRRNAAAASSKRSMWALVLLATITSLIVLGFAYTIINEKSFGTPKELQILNDNSKELKQILTNILPDYSITPFWRNSVVPYRLALEDVFNQMPASAKPLSERMEFILGDTFPDTPLEDHLEHLEAARSVFVKIHEARSLSHDKKQTQGFALLESSFDRYYFAVKQVLEQRKDFSAKSTEALKDLSAFAKAGEEHWNKEGQTADLIKRLSLSVVVIGFFIALLRYIAKYHQFHFDAMLRADSEDLATRRFLVAFRASKDEPKLRNTALESFIKGSGLTEASKTGEDTVDEKSLEMLRDMLTAFLKKN